MMLQNTKFLALQTSRQWIDLGKAHIDSNLFLHEKAPIIR
ncbi:hypothetical protein VAE115_320551 [Vibrio aestuarianus]|nr:hypothetical protein VAE032_270551 [Vibrio aestuarianus]CAH8198849.1 hypothetical protein VAE115_320551 [Vibrio aestuarianus]